MTTTTTQVPEATPDERTKRLDEAGEFWTSRIGKDKANAQLTYKVAGTGEGAVASRLTAGKHTFFVDEPAGLAGDDVAASPVEVALGALISCQVVVYRLYAHNLGIAVESIEAEAEGDLDAQGLFGLDQSVRPGFSEVRLKINITGPETAERYEELQRAVDAHCPVLDLFANATPVKAEVVKA